MERRLYVMAVVLLMAGFVFLSGGVKVLQAESHMSPLAQRVKNAIDAEYWDNVFEVTADDSGRVEIQGDVRTLYDKYRIFDIISTVPGVTHITDNLEVVTENLPDNMVRDNIMNELKLVNSILEPDRINVQVDNGEVILNGKVSFYREKLMAETVASWQNGVTGITNNIEVLPADTARSDQNLKVVLDEILKYRFPLDKNISVTVNNGEVSVSGTVSRMWEKHQIAKTFAGVQGVKKVENQLQVRKTF